MTRARRILDIVLVGALLSACRPAQPSEPSATIDEPKPVPEPIPVEQEPEPKPVETPAIATGTWRFTTLVTGGTEAFERMIGTNGYYEIVVDGDKAMVRKVGQKGTPMFADAEIQSGLGTLMVAANEDWPAAEHRTLEVELTNETAKPRRLVFDLWFFADELHGIWAAPNDKDDSHVGDTWGLLEGRRDAGDPLELRYPLELRNGANSPCMTCSRAFWNCEGISFDEAACNSAATVWVTCEARLGEARGRSLEVPRGCDDD